MSSTFKSLSKILIMGSTIGSLVFTVSACQSSKRSSKPVAAPAQISPIHQKQLETAPSNHLGFWSLDAKQIPDAIKSLAPSVVTVFAPAGELKTLVEIFGQHSIQEISDKIKTTPPSEQLYQGNRKLEMQFTFWVFRCEPKTDQHSMLPTLLTIKYV